MSLNIEKLTTHLRTHAMRGAFGEGKCAKYVRQALEAGGADITGYPVPARNYGPLLIRNGFRVIAVEKPETFSFKKGDMVVMEPTKDSQSGHIAGFDGRNWISDFVQRDFWPGPNYGAERPGYVIYRP